MVPLFSNIPWPDLIARHELLTQLLLDASLDHQRRHEIQKEYAMLSSVLRSYNDIENFYKQSKELELQQSEATDPEFAELIAEEIATIQQRISLEEHKLDLLLYPPDSLDQRDVFLEVRAGTGGQEAALFAGDLVRMYLLYATRKGWDASIVSESATDLGGCREAVLHIKGQGVYGLLKYESGVHRVQRVPATETSGRVHTSTATVAVLPETDEVETSIDPRDLRIDVYRSSGAGGQHVNTTDSAVRITHIPTGVVVACQDERSQHKNKAKAMKVLQARLRVAQEEKRAEQESAQRKKLIGSGERAEKVRTYNVPQNRVTDHHIDLTLKKLDTIMGGDLDPIIIPLSVYGSEERRKQAFPWLYKARTA
jgi:peptide chain release factor 1